MSGVRTSAPLTAFTALLALNQLLYGIRFPSPDPRHTLLFAAAALALFHPAGRWSLVVLCAAGLATFVLESPVASSFLTVIAAIDLGVLCAAVYLGVKERRWSATPDEMVRILRPLVTLIIAATYLFSVFHKLNSAYFDLAVSPVGQIVRTAAADPYPWFLAWYPASMAAASSAIPQLLPWFVLAAEIAIPVMLLVPRWRFAGIIADFIFHLAMGYRVYPPSTNFPCLLLAVCALLLSQRWYAGLGSMFPRVLRLKVPPPARRGLSLAGAALLIPLFFETGWGGEWLNPLRDTVRSILWGVCVIGAALALWLGAVGCRRSGGRAASQFRVFGSLPRPLWALPLLFVANCLLPHLGLKSKGCAEMYSGLLVFGGHSNHLIVPASWSRSGFSADLVLILGSDTSKYLAALGEERVVMPYLEFVRMARHKARHHCRVARRGEVYDGKLADHPGVADPPFGAFALKFLPMHFVPEREFLRLPGIRRVSLGTARGAP